MEKKALGRGLDALLPAIKPVSMPELPEVQHLRIDAIVPNRYQPRQTFSPHELEELTASLKQTGLLQELDPLVRQCRLLFAKNLGVIKEIGFVNRNHNADDRLILEFFGIFMWYPT